MVDKCAPLLYICDQLTANSAQESTMTKDERINIRVTEQEKDALQRAALMELRNETEMAREMIREGLHRRGLWPTQGEPVVVHTTRESESPA
jgi:hypothetical protein